MELVGGLQQAIYDTVHNYVDPARPGHRGAAALAPKLGTSPSVLSNRVNPFLPGHKLGLLESVPLQITARNYSICNEYCAALADSRITWNEVAHIRTSTDSAIRALLGLVHRLEGLAR